MFVPLYNAKGVLTAPLRKDGYLLNVDAALRSLLDTLAGNHTYLRLTGEAGVEIVKVSAVDSRGVFIARAIDNTEALIFNEGDLVDYTLTEAEIADSVSQHTLTVSGLEGIHVVGNTIVYPMLALYTLGATEIVGSADKIVVARKEGAYGCCGGDNEPAPVAPAPYYLTTQLYPIEMTEGMQTDGGFVWVRLNVQPFVYEHFKFNGLVLSGTISGGGHTYPMKPEHFIFNSELLSGTIAGGGKTYIMPPEHFMFGSAFLYGEITGGGVTYEMAPDHFIFDGGVIEGTLE